MGDMTWREFKEFVDSEIKDQGFDENVKIEYIDISYPSFRHESTIPHVDCDENGLDISNI